MHGQERRLVQFLNGSSKRFVVPVYQRNYEWKKVQCEQLYTDLLDVIRKARTVHFFGSIVFTADSNSGMDQYLIIDGQQRVTTISLLLLAMHDAMKNHGMTSNDPQLQIKILEEFLIDRFQPDSKKIKLKTAEDCQAAFDALFSEDQDDHIPQSCITTNYNFFLERILRNDVTIDQLYDAIHRLQIIEISLNADDNAQLIFESLNSTGLALSEAAKIRNYLLMNLSPHEQEQFYHDYWMRIEQNVISKNHPNGDASGFFRDYLSIKLGRIPVMKYIYLEFKSYANEYDGGKEELLKELLKYSKYYGVIVGANTKHEKINSQLANLDRLDCSVAYPFMMQLFELWTKQALSADELEQTLKLIECFLLRRAICGVPTNALNTLFLTLMKDTERLADSGFEFIERLKHVFLSKQGSARFPRDEEFTEALKTRDVYHMAPKNKLYLFERLENLDNMERVDIVSMINEDKLTIEHILPQTLSPQWIEVLGGKTSADLISERWLHKLANLTLTAYNSSYSNRPFQEKRDMKLGYRESGLKMNRYIGKCNCWTEDELIHRAEVLSKDATKLWPLPSTTFVKQTNDGNSYALDEEYDFTGSKVQSFDLLGTTYRAQRWADMYVKVVGLLNDLDESILPELAADVGTSGLSAQVASVDISFLSSTQITDGLFLNTHSSTATKVSNLSAFMERFGLSPSDLTIRISSDNESNDDAEMRDTRFDLRRKFWAELLTDLNEKTHLYKNISPGKDSYLCAAAGIGSGMYYTLAVGMRRAGVYFECYSLDKDKNKALFQYLYEHKAEIEERMGKPLVWQRNDNKLHSKVGVSDNDANLYNEDTWRDIRVFLVNNILKLQSALQSVLITYGK